MRMVMESHSIFASLKSLRTYTWGRTARVSVSAISAHAIRSLPCLLLNEFPHRDLSQLLCVIIKQQFLNILRKTLMLDAGSAVEWPAVLVLYVDVHSASPVPPLVACAALRHMKEKRGRQIMR